MAQSFSLAYYSITLNVRNTKNLVILSDFRDGQDYLDVVDAVVANWKYKSDHVNIENDAKNKRVFRIKKDENGNDMYYREGRLSSSRQTRFTPEVRTDKHYTFEFSFASIDKFGLGKTSALKIDDRDESETFKQALAIIFAGRDDLKDKLSVYYAIPKDKIEITGLGDEVTGVTHIGA